MLGEKLARAASSGAACGVAIDVPDMEVASVVPLVHAATIDEPGAMIVVHLPWLL